MRQCVCGLCLRSAGSRSSQCTIFTEGGSALIERRQTELCKPICLSTGAVGMIQRFIRSLLRDVAALCTPQQGREPAIHLTLQRDDCAYERNTSLEELPASSQVYVVDAMFVPGAGEHLSELLLSLCRPLGAMQRDPHMEMRYALGEKLKLSDHAAPWAMRTLQARLAQAIQEGDGKNHSIVVACPELPRRSVTTAGGLSLEFSRGAHIARPVFLFLQANPGTRIIGKSHSPELSILTNAAERLSAPKA